MENNPSVTREITKSVQVTVEIRPQDLLRALTHQELRDECGRRGIPIKQTGQGEAKPQKLKVPMADLEEIRVLLMRRNVGEALLALEWLLPREFRGFAADVERHFREAA